MKQAIPTHPAFPTRGARAQAGVAAAGYNSILQPSMGAKVSIPKRPSRSAVVLALVLAPVAVGFMGCNSDSASTSPTAAGDPEVSADSVGLSANSDSAAGADSTMMPAPFGPDTIPTQGTVLAPRYDNALPPIDTTPPAAAMASVVAGSSPLRIAADLSSPGTVGQELVVDGDFESGTGSSLSASGRPWIWGASASYFGSTDRTWFRGAVDSAAYLSAPPYFYTTTTSGTGCPCLPMPHTELLNHGGSFGATSRATTAGLSEAYQVITIPRATAPNRNITVSFWMRWKNGWYRWSRFDQDIVVWLSGTGVNVNLYEQALISPAPQQFSGGGDAARAGWQFVSVDVTPYITQNSAGTVYLGFDRYGERGYLLLDLDDISMSVTYPSLPTSTTLTVTQTGLGQPGPSPYGTSLTMMATVTTPSSPEIPTGIVAFVEGTCTSFTNTWGTATLNNGQATLITTALGAALHTLSACYTPASGTTFQPSTSSGQSYDVAHAPLVVGVLDASKVYGDPLPAFQATYTGFVNGENESSVFGTTKPSFQTSATQTSVVGTYPVAPTGLIAANYAIIYRSGTLIIAPRPLSLAVDNLDRLYGDPNPALTGTLSGVVAGDGITAAYATTAAAPSNVGIYPITVTLADPNQRLGNYVVPIPPSGLLTVKPAPLAVTVKDQSMFYGALSLPDLTAPAAGNVTGQKVGDVIGANFATAATPSSPVGSYPIAVTLTDPGNRLRNYTVPSPLPTGMLKISYYRGAGAKLLQPINQPPDQRSAFKIGSTVPVKFQLFTPTGAPVTNARVNLRYVFGDPTPDEAINESVITSSGDAGTSFRYDATSQQYVYNLSTKTPPSAGISQGTWTIYADLDDGTSISAVVDFRSK